MGFTKRQMLFVPEVNPSSFVFFFEKGNSGMSWSIRDYSITHRVRVYRPGDYQWTADEILQKAQHAYNAPAHQTDDLAFWHKYTAELNRKHGLDAPGSNPSPLRVSAAPLVPCSFPVLNLDELALLPKGRKTQDMERILHSSNSEDWVTWNFFQILFRRCPGDWWNRILKVARRRNPELGSFGDAATPPSVRFWDLVSSPEDYLEESRRMLSSRNSTWAARATASTPVEGPSEIDLTIDGDEFIVFIEAKFGSDISMNTTYDPHRNQIARNIDCLLDKAGEREPAFWMLVRDVDASRAYAQLMNAYKSDPALLADALPHRQPEVLERVCRNLAILRWSDFEELVCGPADDLGIAATMRELERRVTPSPSPRMAMAN